MEYFRAELEPTQITASDDKNMRAAYFGNMAEVDAQIGELVDGLKRLGQLDDTLIVFTSDHGDQLGDNWIYCREGPFPEPTAALLRPLERPELLSKSACELAVHSSGG